MLMLAARETMEASGDTGDRVEAKKGICDDGLAQMPIGTAWKCCASAGGKIVNKGRCSSDTRGSDEAELGIHDDELVLITSGTA